MSALVIVMESPAILVATATFGRLVLVLGVPAVIATALVLVIAHVGERRRRGREPDATALPRSPGGLMSGSFRVPAQPGSVELPDRARC